MLGELLRIGDEVEIQIPKENRDWGFNPAPDGTKAKVLGFGEIHYGRTQSFGYEPGVYTNYSWVNIKFGSKELTIGSFCLELSNKKLFEKRKKEFRSSPDRNKQKLRDLPETPFWEDDIVECNYPEFTGLYYIYRIDYSDLNRFCNDGITPYPAYRITPVEKTGIYSNFRTEQLKLVERGNVWKYYHKEPITFSSLKEEMNFACKLGKYKEIKNPANNLYLWTVDEILEAIRNGLVHGFSVTNSFTDKYYNNAIRFNDQKLGQRVAEATLKGFDGVDPNRNVFPVLFPV